MTRGRGPRFLRTLGLCLSWTGCPLTEAGRALRQWIEELTGEVTAPAYDALSPDELDELIVGLEPIGAALASAGD